MIGPRYWGVVMFVKVFAGAVLASAMGLCAAYAQSAADVGGPRERPPAGFAGQQYIDSRGCVFLRAGIGGTVNWVPRVDRNRRAMCGYPPTMGGGTRVAAAADPAPAMAPAPAPATAPAPVTARPAQVARPVAVARTAEPPPESYVPAPVRAANPAPVRMAQAAPLPRVTAPMVAAPVPQMAEPSFSGNRIGCTRSAPVAQRIKLTNGGSVVVCTRGDGTLEGLRAPVYPRGAGVGASLTAPAARTVPLGQPSGLGNGGTGTRVAEAVTQVPPGYRLAWEDDRLNPLRGLGSAEGQAAQDQVWTRKVPATAVADAPVRARVTMSTSNGATAQTGAATGGGRHFVQVGSFAVAGNAAGAAARLSALGLPVAQSSGRIGGKAVQVVLAGPFASAAEAQSALRATRGAGFGDAFLR